MDGPSGTPSASGTSEAPRSPTDFGRLRAATMRHRSADIRAKGRIGAWWSDLSAALAWERRVSKAIPTGGVRSGLPARQRSVFGPLLDAEQHPSEHREVTELHQHHP
jgi:hypothetical protein